MQRRDQRHALEVYRRLRDASVTDPSALAAALLHDCGKGAVPVWLRILYVLRPSLIDRIAREDAAGRPRRRLAPASSRGDRCAQGAGSGQQRDDDALYRRTAAAGRSGAVRGAGSGRRRVLALQQPFDVGHKLAQVVDDGVRAHSGGCVVFLAVLQR